MSELVKELRYLAKEFPAIKYGDEEARNCVEITLTAAANHIEELKDRITELEAEDDKNVEINANLSKRITKLEAKDKRWQKEMDLANKKVLKMYQQLKAIKETGE